MTIQLTPRTSMISRLQTRDRTLVIMALVAGSLLGWEVLLTRLASLRYHFHFGHLAVSNGLLGVGIAATALALWRSRWVEAPMVWLKHLCGAYALSVLGSWAVLYLLPVHRGSMDIVGTTSFVVFGMVAAVPFVFGGGAIGLLLSAWPERVNRLYGVDLVAAGLGCLAVSQLLPWVGVGGVLALVLSAATGSVVLADGRWRSVWGVFLVFSMSLVPTVDDFWPAPSKINRPILHSTWTSLSRVDVVAVSPEERSVRARGANAPDVAIPEQVEIMQDGSASTLLTNFTDHPDALERLDASLYTASARLDPGGSVLVIGVGGGDDVWAALHHGAESVVGVDLNGPVLDAHRTVRPAWSRAWFDDPRVTLTVDEGRSVLMRSGTLYDRVQLTGIDTWAALASGAYMLAENYLYTTDAFSQMLDRVAPGGTLQITRMAAQMESLRVLAQVDAVLGARGITDFAQHVAVLGSVDHQVATLVRPDGFTDEQVQGLRTWAQKVGLTILHLPGEVSTEMISSFVRSPDRGEFIDAFPRNITPTTDDRPYFFNFTRWNQPAVAADTIREPTHISQGNPLFILAHLAWSVLVAAILLLAPLLWGRTQRAGLGRGWVFFGGVGFGFILLELGLIQKLTLLLGHPMRALSVTLAALLIATGLGALCSARWSSVQWVPLAIGAWVVAAILGLPHVETATLAFPVWMRVVVTVIIISPLGFVLGIPFAWGLRCIAAEQVPWAWAANSFFTVIGAVASVVISMNLGFTAVWGLGAACYALAFWAGRMEL